MMKMAAKIFVRTGFLVWILFCPHLLQGNQSEVKICLTMVVENEDKFIKECLNSVKDVVDCISVWDMGCTDNTIKIIEEFMLERGLKGKIHQQGEPSVDQNRTPAIRAAQKTLEELGFSLSTTYLLTLDADMKLNVESSFRKEALNKDAYLLLERSSALSYYSYNARLLRASIPWESNRGESSIITQGWSYRQAHQSAKLHTLMIEDHADANRNTAKLRRDINLLTEVIQNEPDSRHHLFYLAQAHRGLKQYDEALKWYKARIEKGGDKEEIWFSKCMIGDCYEGKGEWDHALYWYLEAYQVFSDRPAPLQKIATHYRLRGENDLAYIFAKHGSRIPHPVDQLMSILNPYESYHFDEELSIASYYTRFKDDGFASTNDLILRKNVPWYIKDRAYQNILFYVQNLKNARFVPITLEFPLITKGSDKCYNPMNPSIHKTDKGYKLICRTVNYTQTGAKIFNTVEPSGIFRTRNFLASYDKDFKLLSQHEIIEDLLRERVNCWISANIQGLDDCRIFEYQNSSWFFCTTNDTNSCENFQVSLCKLANEKSGEIVHVEKLVPLKGPDPYRCEKNWLPFLKEGLLHAIYSYDPFIIYKPNIETGDCETILKYQPSHDFSRFRGSAAPIKFDEGYLMLVHEVVQMPDYERRYLHRFLYLDENFRVKKTSKPFTFMHIGIEFCCSMILDHSGTQLIIPIGIEDREAYLCVVDLETVRSTLISLPDLPNFQ